MTTERDDRLLGIAEAIAEGREVDWSTLPADTDPALVSQFRAIAGLAGRFVEATAPTDAGAAPERTRFVHLSIREPLGQGSNGTVYRAYDEVLHRAVALKLFPPQPGRNDQLLREARLMAQLDHPNVLKVHGAAEQDGVVGFWSDLVEGEPMTRMAEQPARLGTRELVAIGEELVGALAATHAIGVVHGDLKPANIVRHRDGRWIVLDFGSSAPVHGAIRSGTPAYAAPELLDGGLPSPASDLYSLGAVLFRLATGRLPVEADTLDALKARHADGRRPRLTDLRPDLPMRLAGAIEHALARNPDERPASAGAFAAELGAALRDQPAAARARGPWTWMAAGALVLAFAWVVAATWRPDAAMAGVDLRLGKSSARGTVALAEGDAIAPGDALSLDYRNAAPAHVYVLNEDDQGAVFKLFPLTGGTLVNPLPAGVALRLPGRVAGEEQDWRVTSRGGRERFFVVIAASAVPELEQLQVAQARSDLPVIDGARLADSDGPMRGIGGLVARPDAATLGGTRLGAWLDRLRSNYPALDVRRYELDNP